MCARNSNPNLVITVANRHPCDGPCGGTLDIHKDTLHIIMWLFPRPALYVLAHPKPYFK